MSTSLRGKRVTLLGLGTRQGGVGVARYLAREGARVTVTDRRTDEDLAESMAALANLPIRYVLGGHEERNQTENNECGQHCLVSLGTGQCAEMVFCSRQGTQRLHGQCRHQRYEEAVSPSFQGIRSGNLR